MRQIQQHGECGVTARLRQNALGRIKQDNGYVSRRCARDHIACVLLVARRIGDDKAAVGRGEITVSNINGNALLALGDQAICQQR